MGTGGGLEVGGYVASCPNIFLTKSKKGIDNRRKLWYNRIVGNKFSFYGLRSLRTILEWECCFLPTEWLIQLLL